MKEYYQGLTLLHQHERLAQNESVRAYSWHQKQEITALLELPPDFWVAVDYMISLTERILKQKKERVQKDVQTILRPIFSQYRTTISTYLRLSDSSHFYIKQELKTFHHIVSHLANLIDKHMAHFTPSFLLIKSIEQLKLLAPTNELCCNPRTLAGGSFSILFSRYLALRHSVALARVIDYLLWHRHVKRHLIPTDILLFNNKFVRILASSQLRDFQFDTVDDYRIEHFLAELKKVISTSLISETLTNIQKQLQAGNTDEQMDTEQHLATITELFVPANADKTADRFALRDLSIYISLLMKLQHAISRKDRTEYHEQLLLSRMIAPMGNEVIAFLLPPSVGIKVQTFFELTAYLLETYPSLTAAAPYTRIISELLNNFSKEKKRIETATAIEITQEEIELYLDKTFSNAF